MQSSIKFEKLWFDDDVTELKVTVNNGHSSFANKVYVGSNHLTELYEKLLSFKDAYYGGLIDIDFGSFGNEYANGAFNARLHFPKPGDLYISTTQQSDFFEFKGEKVASEAKMFLSTQPGLFDDFILDIKSLISSENGEAELICT